MWKKIEEYKYLLVIKYFILGIILAVIVFQFVTNSIRNNEFDISILIEKETLNHIISILVGGFVGGIIFISMLNSKDLQIKEKRLWLNIRDKNMPFVIKNMIAFSIGGLVYKIIINLFNLKGSNNLIQSLFSTDFAIDYLGIILSMVVLSIIISIGIKRRLSLIYGK